MRPHIDLNACLGNARNGLDWTDREKTKLLKLARNGVSVLLAAKQIYGRNPEECRRQYYTMPVAQRKAALNDDVTKSDYEDEDENDF